MLVSLTPHAQDSNLLVLHAGGFREPAYKQVVEVLAQDCGCGMTNTRTPPGFSQRYVCSRNTSSSL